MKKEICLEISKSELKTIKDLMDFQVMYGINNPYHTKTYGEGNYLMADDTIMTYEQITEKLNSLQSFNREYKIDKNTIFKIEVNSNTDFVFGYINNSLYDTDGNLLIHNTCKYELGDLFKGFCFSTMEEIYNDNTIFDITDLGKEILSSKTYIVKFKVA